MIAGRHRAWLIVVTMVACLSGQRAGAQDCNNNGIPDACDIDCGPPGGPCDVPGCGQSTDCNANGLPDGCDLLPQGTASILFTLDTNPGWEATGLWAWGQPTGGGGSNGYPDPTSGHTGVNVYGYNLAGDYEPSLPERHLTAGPIDCTGIHYTHLRFWRWLGVEEPLYDHAAIRVSNNGTTWSLIWQNSGTISDGQWVMQDFDISAVADTQPTVYIRWTMGPTDYDYQYCGWNIDDVELRGAAAPVSRDCNGNGVPDECDIAGGASEDCQPNCVPDECEGNMHNCCETGHGTGCNDPQIEACVCAADPYCCNVFWDEGCAAEVLSLSCGSCEPTSDCNDNGVLDDCDILHGASQDCNQNEAPDECDIAAGVSQDCQPNGVPDECEDDCNGNGAPDTCDLGQGVSQDCDANGVPDECDVTGGHDCCEFPHAPGCSHPLIRQCVCVVDPYCCEVQWDRLCVREVADLGCGDCEGTNDCNGNDTLDVCDISAGTSEDCNANNTPDECDIASGTSQDANGNGVPDECETAQPGDMNSDGTVDLFDLDPFVLALVDPIAFATTYPLYDINRADVNQDLAINGLDIPGFVGAVLGGRVPGDMDGNGVVDVADIPPFVMALVDPAAFAVMYPDYDVDQADVSGDGSVDGRDMQPMVAVLVGR